MKDDRFFTAVMAGSDDDVETVFQSFGYELDAKTLSQFLFQLKRRQ